MSVGVERTAVGPTVIVALDQHDHRPRKAAQEDLDVVVIVGAGYDTRAYRVTELAGLPIWEVDLARNIAAKNEALERCFGRIPPNVTLVPVDLATDNLTERLTHSGFDAGMRTFYVWESVTMYLPETVVRNTLHHLTGSAPGSHLAFTYLRKDFVDGAAMYGAEAAYQSFVVNHGLWKYGINPERVDTLLAEYGWRETEQLGSAEYRDRYLLPAGRNHPVSEIERAVCAERLPATVPTDIPDRCVITP